MLEALGNLVALNREALVTAVGQLLDDAALVELDNSDGLLSVVDRAHTLRVEFSLKRGLLLLDHFMWQFYLLVVSAINLVPHEAVDVLTRPPHIAVDLFHGILTVLALAMACVDQAGELMQLISLQEPDVHQVDQRTAVFQLLASFIHR